MQLTLSALALCALSLEGALAGPAIHSHHQHLHAHHHHLARDIDYSPKYAPAPVPIPGTQGGPGVKDGQGYLREVFGAQTQPIEMDGGVNYVPNRGSKYGSNMAIAPLHHCDPSTPGLYKYSAVFTNILTTPITLIGWNKVGSDGGTCSGQSSEPNIKITLQPNQPQCLAFDEDSVVGWCAFNGANRPTNGGTGINDCDFGEATFGKKSSGWSAFDESQIQLNTPANAVWQEINCPDCPGNVKTSSWRENGYSKAQAAINGIGANLPAGPVHLQVKLGIPGPGH